MQDVIDEQQLRDALAANVARLRKERGWSQKNLAALAGISRIQLSRIENGHHTPGADVIYGLADAFGVTADQLRQVAEKNPAKSA